MPAKVPEQSGLKQSGTVHCKYHQYQVIFTPLRQRHRQIDCAARLSERLRRPVAAQHGAVGVWKAEASQEWGGRRARCGGRGGLFVTP